MGRIRWQAIWDFTSDFIWANIPNITKGKSEINACFWCHWCWLTNMKIPLTSFSSYEDWIADYPENLRVLVHEVCFIIKIKIKKGAPEQWNWRKIQLICSRRVQLEGIKQMYIWMTDEPEHSTPVQDCSHGSPPTAFHPFSCFGLFRALYMSCNAKTAFS